MQAQRKYSRKVVAIEKWLCSALKKGAQSALWILLCSCLTHATDCAAPCCLYVKNALNNRLRVSDTPTRGLKLASKFPTKLAAELAAITVSIGIRVMLVLQTSDSATTAPPASAPARVESAPRERGFPGLHLSPRCRQFHLRRIRQRAVA